MTNELKKVLVVEDNPALAGVVRFNLLRAGFDVVVAADGQLGWETAQATQFDAVVTDHQMPKMTGMEMCRRLRTLDRYQSVPLIMLTAKNLELDRATLTDELKVAAALSKPFSPTELVAMLQQLTGAMVAEA